jgi:hypothetical protein
MMLGILLGKKYLKFFARVGRIHDVDSEFFLLLCFDKCFPKQLKTKELVSLLEYHLTQDLLSFGFYFWS